MMGPESNPVRVELAKARPSGAHPDADVLTAFTEGTLPKRERTDVLAHLAACAECREVVSLSAAAIPGAASEAQPVRSPARTSGRIWMPWVVATAASVVIAWSVVMVHEQSRNRRVEPPPISVAKLDLPQQVATTLKQPPPSVNAISKKLPPEPTHKTPAPVAKQMVEPKPALATAGASGMAFNGATAITQPAPPQAPQQSLNVPSTAENVTVQSANQTVSVQSTAQNVEVTPVAPPELPQQAAMTEPAQKAAMQGALGRSAAAPAARSVTNSLAFTGSAARFHWRISPEGRAEREAGSGPWQPVLPQEPAKMRVVSVAGDSVWVGGEGQRLYRSTNNGTTWVPIALPTKGTGAHTIAHIRFADALAGTVEAEDGTIWTTTDGGASWK